MLLPKRVKYRRVQRGRMTGKATRGNVVCQGQYGLVALEPAWISSTQIEAARVAMTRYIKRGGKVWIKIFPDKPVTEKPAETRMVPVKALPSTGSLLSSPAAFCSSWQMSMRQLLVRLCAWLCTSCPSSANLLSVRLREGGWHQ